MKQVIVMRNDLNMRKGKMVAQGAHASIAFLIQAAIEQRELTEDEMTWMVRSQVKICVRADSEAELLEIADKGKGAGLQVYVVTDAGHTEFAGVPTRTCLAIGPNEGSEIDKITGHLKLL